MPKDDALRVNIWNRKSWAHVPDSSAQGRAEVTLSDKIINDRFMRVWEQFGDDKSTEFLVQVTAARLGIEPAKVYEAIAAVHDHGERH